MCKKIPQVDHKAVKLQKKKFNVRKMKQITAWGPYGAPLGMLCYKLQIL